MSEPWQPAIAVPGPDEYARSATLDKVQCGTASGLALQQQFQVTAPLTVDQPQLIRE